MRRPICRCSARSDHLGLTGTKYGCGAAFCGACTVQVDGQAVRSCSMPLEAAAGTSVTTIEGLGSAGLHPIQKAWIEAQVPQCGYGQPGLIIATAALLRETPRPTDADIDAPITTSAGAGPILAFGRRCMPPRGGSDGKAVLPNCPHNRSDRYGRRALPEVARTAVWQALSFCLVVAGTGCRPVS